MAHLNTGYPTSLVGWDSRLSSATFLPITEYSVPAAPRNITKTLNVLTFSYAVGATWIMPAAFYECCRYEIKDLINHPAWKGGLGENIKNRIITGFQKQVTATRRCLDFLYKPPLEGCTSRCICLETRRHRAEEATANWATNNPLEIWEESDWEMISEEICAECLTSSKEMHKQARRDLWERLPDLYDLPPWSELLGLKETAMS